MGLKPPISVWEGCVMYFVKPLFNMYYIHPYELCCLQRQAVFLKGRVAAACYTGDQLCSLLATFLLLACFVICLNLK